MGGNYTCSEILGVASWVPPGVGKEPLWPLIPQALIHVGWRSTFALLALFEFAEKLRDRHCPLSHWYLDGLAVAPGRGIGGLLLQPVLELADRQGQECCLYTSTERAVRFYLRQGFTIREEAQFQPDAPLLWFMVRSPQ